MDTAQQSLSSLVIEDDKLQTKVNFFFKELQDLGLSNEQIEVIGQQLIALSTDHLTAKIDMLMNEEEFEKWKKFIDTGPNTAQQAIVINKFLQKKVGKDVDALQLEIADTLMKNILNSLQERRDFVAKISKLNDQELEEATKLLNNNQFEKLDNLLNKE
jgi:hypothetical protein